MMLSEYVEHLQNELDVHGDHVVVNEEGDPPDEVEFQEDDPEYGSVYVMP